MGPFVTEHRLSPDPRAEWTARVAPKRRTRPADAPRRI